MDQTEIERSARSNAIHGYEYRGTFNSFSGTDIVAYIHIPPQQLSGDDVVGPAPQTEPIVGVLGNIQTISYSTFREVEPVRSLGKTYADGYTRGPRTVAGTIIWTVLDQYVLAEALKYANVSDNYDATSILIDQIPPFNIIITFNNEYGDVATMGIYGIRIVNEGSTFSIDDMITEQTNSFIASDIDMLHKGAPFRDTRMTTGSSTGSDIMRRMVNERMSSHGSTRQ
jgi:hypothetical protein